MTGRPRRAIAGLLMAAAAAATPGASASTRAAFPVSPGPGAQAAPAISGTTVVWQDARSGDWDLYALDLATGTERRLTDDPADQTEPAIDGATVVWQDRRSGDWDVWAVDLSGGAPFPVAAGPGDQMHPAISGPRVVWQDDAQGNWDVMLRDLSRPGGAVPVVAQPSAQTRPSIDGLVIAWEDMRKGNRDIFLKDLAAGCEVAAVVDPSDQSAPVVSAGRIAFEDRRSGTSRIRVVGYPSADEADVSPVAAEQRAPSLNGTSVVWSEATGGGWTLRHKDLRAEPVETLGGDMAVPARVRASGRRLAWAADGTAVWSEIGAPVVTITHPDGVSVDETRIVPRGTGLRVVAGTKAVFEAGARDVESGVARVDFAVDGTVVCAAAAAPFTCDWAVVPGLHTLAVTATDRAGNTSTASADFVAL